MGDWDVVDTGWEVQNSGVDSIKSIAPNFRPSVPNPISSLEGEGDLSGITVAHQPTFLSKTGSRIEQNINLIPNVLDALKREVRGIAPTERDRQVSAMGESMRGMVDNPSRIMSILKSSALLPQIAYQAAKGYVADPSTLAGDLATAYLGSEIAPSQQKPQVQSTPKPIDLAQTLTSALKKSSKINVYQEAKTAVPALQEAANLKGLTPEHFQGQQGVQLGKELIDHAIDVHESKFAQLLGPVANDTLPLSMLQKEYPALAAKLTSPSSPWVAKNGTSYVSMNEINAERIAANNLLRKKSTFLMEPTKAAVMEKEAQAIASQGRDALYTQIKGATGVDVSPMKRTESSLLKLKDVMDATAKDLSKKEADFATAPPYQKPSFQLRDIPISRQGAINLGSKLQERSTPPPVSPAEAFNQRMRQVIRK